MTDMVCAVCGGRIGRDQTPRWFHWYRKDTKPRHRIVPTEVAATVSDR